jgi:hypothetical protein
LGRTRSDCASNVAARLGESRERDVRSARSWDSTGTRPGPNHALPRGNVARLGQTRREPAPSTSAQPLTSGAPSNVRATDDRSRRRRTTFEYGCASESAFSLAFRREIGCSPRAYRQQSAGDATHGSSATPAQKRTAEDHGRAIDVRLTVRRCRPAHDEVGGICAPVASSCAKRAASHRGKRQAGLGRACERRREERLPFAR